jgi:pyrrolidone-carboxylate peptidase
MKNLLMLTIFTTGSLWAKPLVLVSYFDPFGNASSNNSERIAKVLAKNLNTPTSSFEVKLCELNTIFDKAYAQTDECLKALPKLPILVIGLGESTCQLKIESIMRNKDKTHAPDNAGIERNNTAIVHGADLYLGLRYPLGQMYCGLSEKERSDINVSNDAGSFVCNNTAYQMSYYHPELQYGFIHVPSNNCSDLDRKSLAAISYLEKMIKAGVASLMTSSSNDDFPHTDNDVRLPTQKDELKRLRRIYSAKEECLYDFLKRSKNR